MPCYTSWLHMKTATLRPLRQQFDTVLALVEQGEVIEINKRGRTIALLSRPPSRR